MKIRPTLARGRSAADRMGAAYCFAPLAAVFAGCVLVAPPARAQDKPATTPATMPATLPGHSGTAMPAKEDGPAYPISKFSIAYVKDHDKLPSPQQLEQITVELGKAADGSLVAWRANQGFAPVRISLAEAGQSGVQNYHQSALLAIDGAIVRYFNQKLGLIGIYVAQSGNDIDQDTGEDLRKPDNREMHLLIWVGVVKEMRTVAAGERYPIDQRINNPAHRSIKQRSPVKPADQGGPDLLKRDAIDEYVFRLNRYPSRRVDVAMSASKEEGGVALDYLVSESKPWSLYAQVSNTGTRQTSDWRERFGFLDNNLTGKQDILSLDYITAGFDDESTAALASYETPLFGIDKLRLRGYASWNRFTASDLGQNAGNQQFSGEETAVGAELIANIFQHRELFIDAVGGIRYKHVINLNDATGLRGEGDFWVPYAGLRLDRSTEQTSLRASVLAMFGTTSNKETNQGNGDSLLGLGRLNVNDNWEAISAEVTESFYLEPLLLPQSKLKTLAHEIALTGRALYSFNNRLVPQEQEVLGGLYTVRGYPESLVAGDNMWLVSAEYRFHLPRALPLQPDPDKTKLFGKPFRWRPSEPLGRTDWDLVLKAFIDAGQVTQNNVTPEVVEQSDTLIGTGVGFELSIKQNMILRVDYGIALRDAGTQDNGTTAGDSRIHVVFTILY